MRKYLSTIFGVLWFTNMGVGIDISQIVYGTGVSVYTRELVKNLILLDSGVEFVFFAGALRQKEKITELGRELGISKKIKMFPLPPTALDILWNRMHILPIESMLGKLDVFHTSDWAEPPAKCPKVTTIHDLSPLLFPKTSHPKIVATHKRKLRWVIAESDRVIVPSSATKLDAVKLGIAEEKIRVIFEAPGANYKPQSESEIKRVKKKYGIDGSYALAVGVSPRKNIERTLKAFFEVKNSTNIQNLIIVGGSSKSTTENGIFYLGHVPTEDLPSLYSGAEVLVYPSLYEGFGLPILEAFSCECPVVTANLSSMAEIAANAAAKVDPHSVKSIANGLVKINKNRNSFIAKGKARVKDFSWEKTARQTLEVYKELL